MINTIREIGVSGFLDIAFMFVLLYMLLAGFKRTRAGFVLTGIFIMACFYLLTRQFNLVMTASVFERFFTVIIIILVVIFQEELRHFFEEIALWGLNRRVRKKRGTPLARGEVETLVRTIMGFAREKTGALIVIKGKDILNRYLDGEVPLDGLLSEPLLKSIFDPHSMGHDGAVIIDGSRVTHFSCHLPLSKNLQKIRDRGTRHAAALGLSERSDALCLVVSEEKGTISAARNGDIRVIHDPEELLALLEGFYEEVQPRAQTKSWEDILKRNSREKVYAALLAIGLWFVLVQGARVVYMSYVVPVSYAELPGEWKVAEIIPRDVEVNLRGPRSAFYFNIRDRIKVYPEIKLQEGPQQVRVLSDDFTFPKGLILDSYDPHTIKIILKKRVPPARTPPPAPGKEQ
ncbi:MAG: diadenylate cyclase [Nitrospiraceae bacterium]|nr:MAG: diadenylate cyclase [Nitrospiraceae bacterium]